MTAPRFGRHGLDTAIDVSKRLQDEAHAELLGVDSDVRSTTLFLGIPTSELGQIRRLRRELYIGYVDRSILERRALVSEVAARVGAQREASLAVRARVDRVRVELEEAAARAADRAVRAAASG